jgi:predicted PurR-regulated permease PerM
MRTLFADRAFQTAWRASLAVLLVAGMVWAVLRAWDVVEPLIVATVLATAVWPWVTRISSLRVGSRGWQVPRLVATALVFVLTFAVAGGVLWFALQSLMPEIDGVLGAYPDQTASLREYLRPFRDGDLASEAGQLATEVARQASGQSAQPGGQSAQGSGPPAVAASQPADATGQSAQAGSQSVPPVNVSALAFGLVGGVLRLCLVLIFTFFLLVDGERCARWMLHWLPPDHRAHYERLRDRVSRWVLAQLLYGAISGLIILVAMWLVGLRSPWLYAIVGSTLGIFPGLGRWVAMVPAFVVALGLSAWQAVAVAAFGLGMYLLDSTTLSTRIYGQLLRLPMFAVLLALLIGAALMGVWGAVIAAPVAAGLQSVLEDQDRPRLASVASRGRASAGTVSGDRIRARAGRG